MSLGGGEGRLLELLGERGLLEPKQKHEVERKAALWGAGPTETLLALGYVDPDALAAAIAAATGLPLLDRAEVQLDPQFADIADLDFFVRHQLMPWSGSGARPLIATTNPYQAGRALRAELGNDDFSLCVTTRQALIKGMVAAFGGREVETAVGGLSKARPELSAKGGLTASQILSISLGLGLGAWAVAQDPALVWLIFTFVTGAFFVAATLFSSSSDGHEPVAAAKARAG